MIVVCPKCMTRFNLPTEIARIVVKLRCSVCKHVFHLSDATTAEESKNALQNLAEIQEKNAETAQQPNQNVNVQQIPTEQQSQEDEHRPEDKQTPQQKSEEQKPTSEAKSENKKEGTSLGYWIILFLLLVAIGVGIWLYFAPPSWFNFLGNTNIPTSNNVQTPSIPQVEAPKIDYTSKILLEDVKHYHVRNERVGVLMVVEGQLRNNFIEPRANIEVNVSLYDKQGNRFATKRQKAGNQLTLFQLQTLSEEELASNLNNQEAINAVNSFIAPGQAIPFMVILPDPNELTSALGVAIAGATAANN